MMVGGERAAASDDSSDDGSDADGAPVNVHEMPAADAGGGASSSSSSDDELPAPLLAVASASEGEGAGEGDDDRASMPRRETVQRAAGKLGESKEEQEYLINRWGQIVKAHGHGHRSSLVANVSMAGTDDGKEAAAAVDEENLTPKQRKALAAKLKKQEETYARREGKWLAMVQNRRWKSVESTSKLKKRVRKGIPDSMRGLVWPKFASVAENIEAHPTRYRDMLKIPNEFEATIKRDLRRTFPNHVLFQDDDQSVERPDDGGAARIEDSWGRNALYNVLRAYANMDPAVGYCQGMGFIAGVFLMYVNEETAFWMLHHVMRDEKVFLWGLYSPGFPTLMQNIFQVEELAKTHASKVHRLLRGCQMHADVYLPNWFQTVFTHSMPIDLSLRIFDQLLFEGPKVMFRMAMLLLRRCEPLLAAAAANTKPAPVPFSKLPMDEVLMVITKIQTLVDWSDTDAVMADALKINITRRRIRQLGKKYHSNLALEKRRKLKAEAKAAKARAKK